MMSLRAKAPWALIEPGQGALELWFIVVAVRRSVNPPFVLLGLRAGDPACDDIRGSVGRNPPTFVFATRFVLDSKPIRSTGRVGPLPTDATLMIAGTPNA